ncbi:MAG: hypothetical protein F2555_06185 [Actinobacteria bacterium]|uniref:Unannotated protein n=1 Tax=freshwater metagenome TaxID=449393 RepID=A0A6J6EU75_9ZZZZ|nr:hypothetical protein [Actinomycetota bacterium]
MKSKVIALVAIIGVLFVLGFRVAHPQEGLQSAMGSAKSSLVVYKASDKYEVGQKVVVVVANSGNQLGVIKSASDEAVDVDTRVAFVRVNQEDVVGKMLVIIPFFGTLFNIVGL